MVKIQYYSEMRQTREAWLGAIPSSWQLRRLKYLFAIKKDIAGELGHTVLSVTQKGIRPKVMTDKGQFAQDYSKYQLVREGDFVMNHMDLLTGWVDISDQDGVTSPDYRVFYDIDPKRYLPAYYRYLFQLCYSARIFYGFGQGVAGFGRWRLPTDAFMNFVLPVPSIEDQRAIAAYLDEQCTQIDSYIVEARNSIEDYKQWKAAIIFEATTKGLKEDAKMRDSGIQWIGNVPAHWRITKTLHCLSMPITDGPHTTPDLFDAGIPFISAEAVSCGNGRIDFTHMRGYISKEFYDECCKKYMPKINDIYMIKSGATTGRVSIVDTDEVFTIWSPLAVFRANTNRILPMFLFYALQSDSYQKQVELAWTFGTQQNIGMRTLETLKICLPPLDEQAAIVTFLSKKCGNIDSLIKEKEAVASDLETYKRSLIYETVTGKRKVV